jgi:hypothetical protein
LWGQSGLKWFGLREEQARPELELSRHSDEFLERNKRFLDLTPGAFPAYSLLSAFGRACTAKRGQLLLHVAKCSTKAGVGVDYE